MSAVWGGAWVAERLDAELVTAEGSPLPLQSMLGMALRRNPRRAQLLVSTVLGKHVPTDPRTVYASGLLLGAFALDALLGEQTQIDPDLLNRAIAGDSAAVEDLLTACGRHRRERAGQAPDDAIVIGYAETATGLGHAVADACGLDYVHSTRRHSTTVPPAGGFEEEHSHATGHLLLPADPGLLTRPGPVVFVDDELSTGTTVLNTIEVLHRIEPRERYLVAALVDLRSAADHERMAALASRLGARIEVVALARGELRIAGDAIDRARPLLDLERDRPGDPATASVSAVAAAWPAGTRDGGRHGFTAADRARIRPAASATATQIAARIPERTVGARVLVLGHEELMHAPLLIALALGQARPELAVRYSTTTRSPVLAIDDPAYAIRTALRFPSHDDPDDGPGPRFAYNVAPGAGQQPFTDIVLVLDDAAATADLRAPGGLLESLRGVCDAVQVITVPSHRPAGQAPGPRALHGPEFGSYLREDVSWLLTDLSEITLEAPTEDREEAIQSGAAHYAESLPIEYQPTAEYRQLYDEALEASATRIAHAVGVLTELVLDARGRDAVLVSLARAGTPIGVLMRRWARLAHGLDLPHYAVSIVRGRGIDETALAHIAGRHDPAAVMFVDGWTGKGAISRELADAVAAANTALGSAFSPDLAVLADPGGCVGFFGTRADFLIPSACLNSTVSGLVSRTVLNDRLLAPGQFHGAKFYRDLADADVSQAFLDAIAARFPAVAADVTRDWPALRDSDRTPTWAGWAATEAISAEYGIDNVNLVKPGVGETTRVLLRRVPWRVLVRRDAEAELGHIRLLAAQRGVPIEVVDDLPYSCVGLIHPKFTRAAIGADGLAAKR
ncbi:phosphoribosyltransferase [Tomitella biformata]|uniref:phosphoribosyltransferase n=1 Tax=Tomitella biformata TaxID=630403 RepID=UPI0004B77915|nr:phosphoribosyltransferase [Tomitella biformata]